MSTYVICREYAVTVSEAKSKNSALRSLLRPGAEAIQRLVWWSLDVFDGVLGRKHPMAPPRRMMNVGSASYARNDYHSIADQLMAYLQNYGGFKSDDIVLDVGCGVGRMAIPLSEALDEQGAYEGFDIIAESVEHCTRNITPRFPKMRFQHANIYNSFYNPNGEYTSEQYKFPYPDDHFTFVFLTSVFTHMLSDGMENYLKEIHRVMQPGGRCFITYFLLNPESEALIAANKSRIPFVHPIANGRSSSLDSPEAAIAFDEAYVRARFADLGLEIQEPVQRGGWCERPSEVGLQDFVIAIKR